MVAMRPDQPRDLNGPAERSAPFARPRRRIASRRRVQRRSAEFRPRPGGLSSCRQRHRLRLRRPTNQLLTPAHALLRDAGAGVTLAWQAAGHHLVPDDLTVHTTGSRVVRTLRKVVRTLRKRVSRLERQVHERDRKPTARSQKNLREILNPMYQSFELEPPRAICAIVVPNESEKFN